jgi:hypothetical protein
MPKKRKRKVYHTFKRRLPDGEIFEKRCLERNGTQIVEIYLTLAVLDAALRADGVADSQNCAGSICTRRHRAQFNHPVGTLVDWWRSRTYIDTGHPSKHECYTYAHYDATEGLFDTPAGLRKLRRMIERGGPRGMRIVLYPIKAGRHPRTGKPTRPSGPRGASGEHRQIRGGDLRLMNSLRARMRDLPATGVS